MKPFDPKCLHRITHSTILHYIIQYLCNLILVKMDVIAGLMG